MQRRPTYSLFVLACVVACSDDSGATAGTTAGGSTAASGSADDGDDGGPGATAPADDADDGDDTTASPGSSGAPQDDGSDTTVDPGPPAVHWVGRHDASDPMAVRMGWSGVGLVVRFSGTGASVSLDDAAQYFTVVVDGEVQPTLATTPGQQSYTLATGLPDGEHTVELYRRTEGSFGPTVVHGVELEGELLPPPIVERRMEVIGDSITCGYGNEGTAPCSFSAETENHFQTYGAIAARAVGAELSTVAWSGKGVVNNYGDDTFEPMPEIYDRLLASDPAAWDFSWQPDVVVINLGTNDFSTDGDPPQDVFVPAYVEFLAHLRDVYPAAFILAVAPSLFGDEATMVAGYLQAAVDERHAAGDPDVAFADINITWIGSGCDGHPTVATHEGMAANLVQELATHLGW